MKIRALPISASLLIAGAACAPGAMAHDIDNSARSAPQIAPATPDQPAATPPRPARAEFAQFTPTNDPIRHRIDYAIWDYALKNIVISMGPSNRRTAGSLPPAYGTRIRQGHNSRYRLEGSLVSFLWLDDEVISSLTEYRRDLESVPDTLDLAMIPRNEQLAFWINLHNVALLEQLALHWPVRQPRSLEIDGVLLDDAKVITVQGVSMSLKELRENIVYANWRDPKVIYGFWRGEIGSPALQRDAYTGANVSSLLDLAADDYVNSLRGTQKSGSRLDVSTLYEETRAFYFPDFEQDVRTHLSDYARSDVTEILGETETMRASIREFDIADLSGGKRLASYLFVDGESPRAPQGLIELLRQRETKLDNMRRRDEMTGQVIFSNIDLPGDPPNKNAVQ
ncbi:MAG: DUF547 domain-containing protein [Pseudomonadota bacterium]